MITEILYLKASRLSLPSIPDHSSQARSNSIFTYQVYAHQAHHTIITDNDNRTYIPEIF